MCGITGIYTFDGSFVSKEQIRHFTSPIQHRGMDGEAYEILNRGFLGLGHRRLSILDLSENGRQPMSYADERYWIAYNGEVYNFPEIKKELENKGHKFRSQSDTEVVLASYAEWGKACLDKFNGDWAMAIWDEREQELFLARDRFGVKPLYYYHKPGHVFAFSSETTSFKHLQGYRRNFNEQLLSININDPYALEGLGYTPFENILQILPGHCMIVKKGAEIQQKRWWHIAEHLTKDIPKSLDEQSEKFYDIFRDSCKIRLASDVPLGTALSGGVDSSAVYSVVSDILNNDLPDRVNDDSQRAFTAIFPGLPQDEQEYAQRASEYVGGNIQTIETTIDNLSKTIETETKKADFLSTSPIHSISSVYAGMKRSDISVSMDGHGVDEMMYGYRDMVYALYNHALFHGTQSETQEYTKVLQAMYHPDLWQSQKQKFEQSFLEKSRRENSLIYKLKKLIKSQPAYNSFLPVRLDSLSDKPYDFTSFPLSERMLYNQFFQHTLPALLRNFDRASMMNGVEIRMPFMDWRLVTYVFSLPVSSKIGMGFTKLILRQAMKGKMDESIRNRTFKVGIGSPVEHWFNGVLKEWVMDNIKEEELKEGIFSAYQKGALTSTQVRQAWMSLNVQLISD